MESSQIDGVQQSDVSTPTKILPVPKSATERWLIALVAMLVFGLILAAVAQSVFPDVMRQVRRWTRSRPAPVPRLIDPVLARTTDTDSSSSSNDGVTLMPADAQISPPRRRTREAKGPAEIAATSDADSQIAAVAKIEDLRLAPVLPENRVANASDRPVVDGAADSSGMLEAAAQLVNLSWQDFAYPVHWNAAETSRPRMLYGNHRNRLLKAIAHRSPSALSLEMARKDYAAARTQFGEDPRLDYAFGLVLWKHEQFAEAIDMFQIAARLEGIPFLPAAMAVAWGRFLNHDDRRGLDQLLHVARVLAAMDGAYPTEIQKDQAAISMGRALGYLTGPGSKPEMKEAVDLTSINIMKRLPEGLRSTCETGRSQVGLRQSELMQLASISLGGIRTDHRMQRDDLQSRIEDLRVEMRDARNSLVRKHVSYLGTIKNVLKEGLDMRAQMEKLRPKFKQLTDAVFQAATPQPHVETKVMPKHYHVILDASGQGQVVQNSATMTFLVQETPTERAARVSKLDKIRDERKKIEAELAKLRDQQTDLLARKHKAERDHGTEKDEARKERVARIQEQRQLESKLQALDKALRRTMALREGVDTIAAYIPWNVEVEGEALWQALVTKSSVRAP